MQQHSGHISLQHTVYIAHNKTCSRAANAVHMIQAHQTPTILCMQVVRILPRLTQLRELLGSCRPYGLEDEASPGDGMEVGGQPGVTR